ncbi:MAG: hypothetical protein KDD67_16400 [Ignavibacteriae bacterium]|nr:hypothetical protein [Ignavibacteriota bacterium]MCB9217313.1 hypothetical protein [Ignavibacteria bacterium]
MREHQQIIEALEQLKRDEIHAAEYYLSAAREAGERNESEQEETYMAIRKVHGELALMFDHRREALEREDGEGILGDTLHAFIDAIRSLVNMPVLFFEGETEMSAKNFVELENGLANRYRQLIERADSETADLLRRAIEGNEKSVEHLQVFVGA